jgi:hypothetical protein
MTLCEQSRNETCLGWWQQPLCSLSVEVDKRLILRSRTGKALQMSIQAPFGCTPGPRNILKCSKCSVKGKTKPFFAPDISRASFLTKCKVHLCKSLYFLHLCKSFWPGLTLRSYMFPSHLVCSRCTGSKGIVPQTGRPIEIAIGPWAMVHISISGGKYKFWPGMSICIPHLWACLFLCIYYICIYII